MLNTDRLCMGCMNDNGGEPVCAICGYDSSSNNPSHALQTGVVLNGKFIVGKVLSANSEGITYIGWDNETNSVVNIREFYPGDFCLRDASGSVIIKESYEFTYNNTLLKFRELSERLVQVNDLPALCPVVAIFEENATVYRVTKAASGVGLNEFLIKNGGTLEYEQAKTLFLPLISTVKGLHDVGIIHRGISPDTIIVGRDGKLKLIGICIKEVRTSRGEFERELFPGYSAIEQYGFDEQTRDSAATDVYSIAATLFRVLIGNCPPEANTRLTDDNMSIPAKIAESLPRHVLIALANALQIMPSDRTQTVDQFRHEIIKVPRGTHIEVSTDTNPEAKPKTGKSKLKKNYTLFAILGTLAVCIIIFFVLMFTVFRDAFFGTNDIEDVSSVQSVPSKVTVTTEDTFSSKIKTYSVPNFVGKSFAEITNESDYVSIYKFEIADKEFSDKYAKGTVIKQSIAEGTSVEADTTITFTVSLGAKTVKVPELAGKSKQEAYISLLELGFLPQNIVFVDKYDDTASPLSVINTEPAAASSVYPESSVVVYVNTYEDTNEDEMSETETDTPYQDQNEIE